MRILKYKSFIYNYKIIVLIFSNFFNINHFEVEKEIYIEY